MNMPKTEWKEIRRFILVLFVILLFVIRINFFMGLLAYLIDILMPLLIGIVIGFLLNRIMMFYEKIFERWVPKFKEKPRRVVSILLSFLTLLVIIGFIINIVVPELIRSVNLLLENINVYIGNLEPLLRQIADFFGFDFDEIIGNQNFNFAFDDLSKTISNVVSMFSNQLSQVIPSLFSFTKNMISVVATFFISIFMSVYLLIDKKNIFATLKRLVKGYTNDEVYQTTEYVSHVVIDTFNKYVAGQILDAFILGFLCFLGMWIFRFDYAMLVGVLIGTTALVPILGSFIGGAVSFFILLMISPIQAILFLIFLLILQQIDNNFIYPYVVGGSIGLPPLLVLLSIMVGGATIGVFGMILAVPTCASVFAIIKADLEKRELRKKNQLH